MAQWRGDMMVDLRLGRCSTSGELAAASEEVLHL